MKRFIGLTASITLCFSVFSQETLQSVTDRGASTSKAITIGGAEISGGYTRHYHQGQMVTFVGTDAAAFGQGGNDAIFYVYDINAATPGKFHIATGNSRRFTVDGYGKVGIGTVNPGNKLSIYEPGNGNAYLDIGNSAVRTFMGASNTLYGTIGTSSNHDFSLHTNGSEKMRITSDGNVGIGTNGQLGHKLAVAGSVIAESVTVKLQSSWPDYVFKSGYDLIPLSEVKAYIEQHKRLPDMPSEVEVDQEGINLGAINTLLVRKLEEMTLYLIRSQEEVADQQRQIDKLTHDVSRLIEIIK